MMTNPIKENSIIRPNATVLKKKGNSTIFKKIKNQRKV